MGAEVVVVGLTVGSSAHLLGRRLTMLADHGWRVHLVVGDEAGLPADLDPRVRVEVIPMARAIAPVADARALWAWWRLLRSLRPTVVLVATPKAGLLGGLAARFAGVPRRIYEVWGARWDGMAGSRGRLLRGADRVAFGAATETVSVSPSLASLVVESGVARRPPIVLPHWGSQGVDLDRFQPAAERPADRPPTIGFVGRLAADKGLSVLPSVVDHVRREVPDVVIRIAGGPDPADPLPDEVATWLASDPAVAQWGFTDDVPAFLRSIDVLVFPSRREGLPNAVIEAAASGVPTVAWRVTGCRDAVLDGETGFLVEEGDVVTMGNRLVALLRDEEQRRRLGRQARVFAEERFASDSVQRDLDSLVSRTVEE